MDTAPLLEHAMLRTIWTRIHSDSAPALTSRYEGKTANGVPNGAGKMTYSSGDVYEGYFKVRHDEKTR